MADLTTLVLLQINDLVSFLFCLIPSEISSFDLVNSNDSFNSSDDFISKSEFVKTVSSNFHNFDLNH